MPRAARGSTNRVPMNEELRLLQEQIYAIPSHETKESDLDDSATVAIPKNVLSSSARKGLHGTEPESDADDTDNADNTVGADASFDEPDTAAIPQRGAADTQQSEQPEQPERSAEQPEQPEQRKQTKQSDQSASSNPRAGWR